MSDDVAMKLLRFFLGIVCGLQLSLLFRMFCEQKKSKERKQFIQSIINKRQDEKDGN